MNKALVEQAGGDERAAFEQWLEQHMSHHFSPELDLAKYEDSGEYRYNPAADYWKAWQARAALAQPSPAQAEAERPEVVARVVHSNPVVLGQCGPLNANDELMTVAQHAASVARWAEMFNRVEQQRDVAQARVAELELKLDQSDYSYDNDRHHMRGMAKQAAEAIQVFTGHDSGANLAHRYGEKWWEHLDELRDALLAFAKNAPPAQAQHSVPELDQLYSMLGAESQVDAAKKIAELVGCRLSRSALTEAQMRRLYDNSTEAENEQLGFAAFARMIRRAEAVHQIAAAVGQEGV
ncbi:hypothetical protein ACEPUQ_28775 [Pseudomonas aeruginosa]